MAIKGVALTVTYTAWNVLTGLPQLADAGNHTLRLVRDGIESTPSNSPSEVDAVNAKGEYKLALTLTEMTADFLTLCGVSATANVVILPVKITTEHGVLPAKALGTGAGAFNLDSQGYILADVTASGISVYAPVAPGGDIRILAGDSYYAADVSSVGGGTRRLQWTDTTGVWPSLSGAATPTFTLYQGSQTFVRSAVFVTVGVANQVVGLELSDADTLAMPQGTFPFKIRTALSNGHPLTLVDARVTATTA